MTHLHSHQSLTDTRDTEKARARRKHRDQHPQALQIPTIIICATKCFTKCPQPMGPAQAMMRCVVIIHRHSPNRTSLPRGEHSPAVADASGSGHPARIVSARKPLLSESQDD